MRTFLQAILPTRLLGIRTWRETGHDEVFREFADILISLRAPPRREARIRALARF